jgi:hypothetical protein
MTKGEDMEKNKAPISTSTPNLLESITTIQFATQNSRILFLRKIAMIVSFFLS